MLLCLGVEAVSTWTHSPLTHDKKTTKQTKALTYAVRIIAVGDHEPNASFGKVVERLGVIVGLVVGSLLEKVVEAPASNEHEQTRRAYDEVNSNANAPACVKKRQLQRLRSTCQTRHKFPRRSKRQLGRAA